VPSELEDVSKYPRLFTFLLNNGWNAEDLVKLAGGNILRVMEENEKVFYVLFIK
jgi:membrane dipeptidase